MKNPLRFSLILSAALTAASICLPVHAANPQSYPMVCRGGGTSLINFEPKKDKGTLVSFSFNRGPQSGSSGLAPGRCAWSDRALDSNEPRIIKMYFEKLFVTTSVTKDSANKFRVNHRVIGNGSNRSFLEKLIRNFYFGQEFHVHVYNNRKSGASNTFVVTRFGP